MEVVISCLQSIEDLYEITKRTKTGRIKNRRRKIERKGGVGEEVGIIKKEIIQR